MKLTSEELRKVYQDARQEFLKKRRFCYDDEAIEAAILAVYLKGFKDGAERQRAVEPTEEMLRKGALRLITSGSTKVTWDYRAEEVYRAMQSVAPLVVPECPAT